MNDMQRQAYLQAMGIQSYFPRVVVAGAKPSRTYDLLPQPEATQEPDLPRQETPRAVRPGRPKPVVRPESTTARATLTSRPVTPPPTVVTELTSPAAQESAQRRFRVNYYRITDTLAVIDEVPYQQTARDAKAALALLRAILAAVGVATDGLPLQAETFDWPQETSMSLTNDPTLDAQLALQGYIRKRQETDSFRHLLIFAAQVAEILAPEGIENERDQPVANNNYNRTITHSIQSLLAHPILKREVWAQLQPLRRRLVTPDQ